MPLELPAQVYPQDPFGLFDQLTGPRVVSFRYELLDRRQGDFENWLNEAVIGPLDGVEGGSVSWENWSAIKGAGTLTVRDVGQELNWETLRIRIVCRIEEAQGAGVLETYCGVWLPSVPIEDHDASGRFWTVELLDKNSILDQDIPVDVNGNPVAYTLEANTAAVVATVRSLIESCGERGDLITPSTRTSYYNMVWDMGTTKLKIINDLLDSINYTSLWCDGKGQYRATPYVEPANRVPIYTQTAPFTEGERSVLGRAWKCTQDQYGLPNRMVAIGEGTDDAEAWVAVVENTDAADPHSFPSKGRWITVVDTGVAAQSQADLLAYAKRRMTNLTKAAADLSINHLYLPELLIDSVVRFEAGGRSMLCVVRKTDLKLDPLALSTTELRSV